MRVDIIYKFISGFIIVIGSIVAVGYAIPLLGIKHQWQDLFTTTVAILIGLVLGWFFSKTFTTNIRFLTCAAERLSCGDLSRPIKLPQTLWQDETHDLAASLNTMMDSLKELVKSIQSHSDNVAESALQLTATSEQITSSAAEVVHSSENINVGAETQKRMVSQCSQLIRDMAESTDHIFHSATRVNASAIETTQTANNGSDLAQTNLAKMKEVLDEAEKNNLLILSFGEKVHKIGAIIEVITNIAQKTNLLALNASIEAVRAGEYGRGFAIVADEIGKLSDSTGASAAEISQLIGSIREENQRLQESLKGSVQKMDLGRNAFDGVSKSFNEIIEASIDTQSKSETISGLSRNQTSLAEKIVSTIEEIARVTNENASATVEVSAVAEEQSTSMQEMVQAAAKLSRTSEELLQVVSRFHLQQEIAEEESGESTAV